MHAECLYFFSVLKEKYPTHFIESSILEFGSYCVNFSLRDILENCDHVGVDLIAGPNVSFVGRADEYTSDRRFKTVVSAECFEHNPYYRETFQNMVRNAEPGALVAFSCATTGRSEHGTTRSHQEESPGTVALGWEYYQNLTAKDFDQQYLAENFSDHMFLVNNISCDLYFFGFVKDNIDVAKKIIDHGAFNDRILTVQNSSRVMQNFWAARDAGDHPQALQHIKIMQFLFDKKPDFVTVKYLVEYLINRDRSNFGIISEMLSHCTSFYPESYVTWYLWGCYFYKRKKFRVALGFLDHSLALFEHDSAVMWLRAECFLGLNQFEDALQATDAAITIDSSPYWFYIGKYKALLALGRSDEAIIALREAAGKEPDNSYIEKLLLKHSGLGPVGIQ